MVLAPVSRFTYPFLNVTKLTRTKAVVNQSVPRSPLSSDIRIRSHHSREVNLVLNKYLPTKGKRIMRPKRCSRNIMVIGGSVYKCLRMRPSKGPESCRNEDKDEAGV